MSTGNIRRGAWVEPLLTGEKDVAHFEMSDVGEIPEILARCAAMGAETVVVNGGDGTADLVFGGLLNHAPYSRLPALALLPAGKTNMTAAGWSLTGGPEDALRTVLDYRSKNELSKHVIERPVLGVHRGGAHLPLYGAFFGAAEVVDGIQFCRRHIYPLKMPNALSHTAAISILLWRSVFARRNSRPIVVAGDQDLTESGQFFVIAVTALDQLLLGLRPMPENTTSTGGSLTYLSLRAGASTTLPAMGSLFTRRVGPGPGRTVRTTERLSLNFSGTYTLDGELYEARADETLTLDGSKRLRFIRLPKHI